MPWRVIIASVQLQIRLTRRNIEDVYPVLTLPFSAFLSLAILQHSGRLDLAGYALVSAGLMSVGQMAFFEASELLARERMQQTLELAVACPTPCYGPLLARIVVVTMLGTVGIVVAWALARFGFGVSIPIYHPWILAAALAATIVTASVTALITSTVFCFGKTTRTYQNVVAGPLYLLAGVLVPVAFLPWFIRPVSRLIFLYWSAELMRASMLPQPVQAGLSSVLAILALGVVGGGVGTVLFGRLLGHLRREGTIGL